MASASQARFLMGPATAVVFAVVAWRVLGPAGLQVILPPAAAFLAGAAVAWPQVRDAGRRPEAYGKALVLAAIPQASLVIAFAGAFLLLGPEAPRLDSPWPLWILAVGAAAPIGAQALALRSGIDGAVASQDSFKRFMLPYFAASLLSVAALAAAIGLAW